MCGPSYRYFLGGSPASGIIQEGSCQIYPLENPPIDFANKWRKKQFADFQKVLPEGEEANCVYVFFLAGRDIGQVWAGVSETYLNQAVTLATLGCAYHLQHQPIFKSKITAAMWKLIQEGYVQVEQRETGSDQQTNAYFPTEKLIAKMSSV